MFFWFSLNYLVVVLFAFVELGLAFSVLSQKDWLGLRNDLFCVEWDVKPQLSQC